MRLKKHLYACICMLLIGIGSLQAKEVTLTEAGTLSGKISDSELTTLTELTVNGPINGSDIQIIRAMGGTLKTLNLKNANIVEGGNSYYLTDTKEAFTAQLTGLSYNTLYNIRAYATNNVGTGYSQALSFETGSSSRATLGELICTKSEAHSLSFSFEVTNTGGAELTAQGFKWRKSGESEYTNAPGTLTGNTVTGTITGLTENSGYYVYGYVTNKNGETTVGHNNFNTAKLPPGEDDNPTPGDDDNTRKPKLSYLNYSEVYATTAWLNCSINDEGNLKITEKGFIYKVDDGTEVTVDNGTKIVITTSGTGMKTKLTGLTGKTTYRVRAYAINAKGTGYSGERYFTTEDADKPGPGGDDNPTPEPKSRSINK